MTITGYTDATFQEIVGKPLFFTINPESCTLDDTLRFTLVLDSTDSIPDCQEGIQEAIAALKSVMYRYNGSCHAPNFVKIEWGDVFTFKGTIQSFDVSYMLFRPDGTPLRAKIGLCYAPFKTKTIFPN